VGPITFSEHPDLLRQLEGVVQQNVNLILSPGSKTKTFSSLADALFSIIYPNYKSKPDFEKSRIKRLNKVMITNSVNVAPFIAQIKDQQTTLITIIEILKTMQRLQGKKQLSLEKKSSHDHESAFLPIPKDFLPVNNKTGIFDWPFVVHDTDFDKF
jgi:hypothetical protein